MPNVPDFKDLNRARRVATSRLSFRNAIINGLPNSQSVAIAPATPSLEPDPFVSQYFFASSENETFNIDGISSIVDSEQNINSFNVVLDGVTITCEKIDDGVNAYVLVTMGDTQLSYTVEFTTETYLPVNGVNRRFYFLNTTGIGSIWGS